MNYVQLFGGFFLLLIGAEVLVRGASRLASSLRISPLIIGLTVVAYGTSSPELAVSLKSVTLSRADIAIGNVVGSNIFNVLFILGISAMIGPLLVSRQLIRLDVPIMIGTSVIMMIFALNGSVGRLEGGLLFLGGVAYTWFLIGMARREKKARKDEFEQEFAVPRPSSVWQWILNLIGIGAGILLLIWGSQFLVKGAVALALSWGIDELVIGLTIIAAGTSLPEVATSIMASIKGERDIAVGNIVGSNIFNLLVILGLTALYSPSGLAVTTVAIHFDIPVMVVVAIACLPIFFSGGVISRWEGAVFFIYYSAYTLYLVLQSTQHGMLALFSKVFLLFVIPITLLTLLVISLNAWKKRGSQVGKG